MLKAAHLVTAQMERHILIGNAMQPKIHYQQQGFTYIGVLVIVAVMMMALGAASQIWHSVMQREKEQELLFIGHQFRAAIGQYYAKSGGRYPPSLDALLELSDLGVKKVRFLRKLYKDPMTGESDWGLVVGVDKKITGIYSLSEEKPYKTTGFINADAELELAKTYSDWKFVYMPKPRGQSTSGSLNGISGSDISL